MIADWKKHIVGCPAMRSGVRKDCTCGAYEKDEAHIERTVTWPNMYKEHGGEGGSGS